MSYAKLRGFLDDADRVPFTAAADFSAGDVVVVQGRVGVVLDDVLSGAEGTMIVGTDVNGIMMPKATGAISQHQKVYWDEDGDPVSGDAGSGALKTVGGGVEDVQVDLVAGGAAGNHTVAGIATADRLISVLAEDGTSGVTVDLTAEFSITAANTINNTGGTNTTGKNLIVTWRDASQSAAGNIYVGRCAVAAVSGDAEVAVQLLNL